MRWIAIAATLLLAGTAHAQTLYKCASRAGSSYQQTPCPPSMRLVRAITTTPDPAPTAAQLAEQSRKAERDRAESAFLSHLAGTDQMASSRATRVPSAHAASSYRASGYRASGGVRRQHEDGADRCRAAQAGRDRALRAIGLKRNFDTLRRLDDDVAEACRRD